ncbi:hypothetical protein CDAR_101701 [Caerostris darwini]|uniref:Uncharacterized protein n=1 Tax=Caerostris darwini TaxID=1538125 RepID=A0AAV4SC19_9ARAC|nr:hypothetical protein CDAR_101701 [Caerostris darwini]
MEIIAAFISGKLCFYLRVHYFSVRALTARQQTLDALKIPPFGKEELEAKNREGLNKSRQALAVRQRSIYTVAPIKHSYHGDYPSVHFQKTTRLSESPLLLRACGDSSPTNHVMRLKFHLLAEELQTRKFIKSRQALAVAKHPYHGDYTSLHFKKIIRLCASPLLPLCVRWQHANRPCDALRIPPFGDDELQAKKREIGLLNPAKPSHSPK